jgi:hypothetical protein
MLAIVILRAPKAGQDKEVSILATGAQTVLR